MFDISCVNRSLRLSEGATADLTGFLQYPMIAT